MKNFILFVALFLLGFAMFSQDQFDRVIVDSDLSIGSTELPATSSILDISSTTSGVLFPRMTTAERDAISTPATSLWIYNSDDAEFQMYDGASWSAVGGGDNMANADLTLDADRTHDLNGFDLDFTHGTGSLLLKDLSGTLRNSGGGFETNDDIIRDNGTDDVVQITTSGTGSLGAIHLMSSGTAFTSLTNLGIEFARYLAPSTKTFSILSSNTSYLRIYDNVNANLWYFQNDGAFGVGEVPTAKLHIKGSGSTSATTTFLLENSTGQYYEALDDGDINHSIDKSGELLHTIENNTSTGGARLRFFGEGSINAHIGVLNTASSFDAQYDNSMSIASLGQPMNITYTDEIFFVKDNSNFNAPTIRGTINSSGQWGLGNTMTPTARVHIRSLGVEDVLLVEDVSSNSLLNVKSTGEIEAEQTTSTMIVGGTGITSGTTLELKSTTGGFLPPRMTSTQASAITVGAGQYGLVLYVTDTNGTFTQAGLWCYVEGTWTALH